MLALLHYRLASMLLLTCLPSQFLNLYMWTTFFSLESSRYPRCFEISKEWSWNTFLYVHVSWQESRTFSLESVAFNSTEFSCIISLTIYLPFNFCSSFLILLLFKTLDSLDWCSYFLTVSLLWPMFWEMSSPLTFRISIKIF